MWRYAIPAVLFAVLVAFFAQGLNLNPGYIPSPLIGKKAPEFSLPNLLDAERTLTDADLRGHYSLLNVWATWCVGCYEEHAFLVSLARSGVIPIYGLNWKDQREDAIGWLQQLGNPYQAVGFDDVGKVAIDWGVYGAPETFLIKDDGTIIHKHLSPLTREIWQRDFLPLLSGTK